MADLAEILQVTVVKPGDTLIVRVSPDISHAEVEELKRQIVIMLPERTRVVIMGVDEIAIACPNPDEHAHG